MKVHYAASGRNHYVRFINHQDPGRAVVLLSLSESFALGHTLLVLDDVEIAPRSRHEFLGHIDLEGRPVKSGWLGGSGDEPLLTFDVQGPVAQAGAVRLVTGELLDGVPATGWFLSWRITVPNVPEREVIFEKEGRPAST